MGVVWSIVADEEPVFLCPEPPWKPGWGYATGWLASVSVDFEVSCTRVLLVFGKRGTDSGVHCVGMDIFSGSAVHGKSVYSYAKPPWIPGAGFGLAGWPAPVGVYH